MARIFTGTINHNESSCFLIKKIFYKIFKDFSFLEICKVIDRSFLFRKPKIFRLGKDHIAGLVSENKTRLIGMQGMNVKAYEDYIKGSLTVVLV